MEKWHATRPVDVARFNGGVFLVAARAYLVLFLVLLPVDVIGAMVVDHHRLPTFSTAHVLSIALPFFVTGFSATPPLSSSVAMSLIAVGSLAWWRHVLAVGGPSAALAVLASAIRRVVVPSRAPVATPVHSRSPRSPGTDDPSAFPNTPCSTSFASRWQSLPTPLLPTDTTSDLRVRLADPRVRLEQLILRRTA